MSIFYSNSITFITTANISDSDTALVITTSNFFTDSVTLVKGVHTVTVTVHGNVG